MGAKNSMTITTPVTDKKIAADLWNAPVCTGPYKRTDAEITREFIALQSRQTAKQLVSNAPNWFGVPAGVFATLRRPSADGSGKLGKNGWTAELLMEHDGKTQLLAGLTIGEINALPASAFVRIVNVKPADPAALASHYTSTAFVRGSQKLPDADRNPVTGAILKPDAVDVPAPKPDASTNVETPSELPADNPPNRKTRRASKQIKK
jgi:hypothetical protein